MPTIIDENPNMVTIDLTSFAVTSQTDWLSVDSQYFTVSPTDITLKGSHVITVTLSDGFK